MAKIVGNVVGIPNPQSDCKQNDPTKADYIKNKPIENGEGESSIQAPNSKAISKSSIAFGENSIAGCKGYYFYSIDFRNNTITLTKEQGIAPAEAFVVEYSVGDIISLNNGKPNTIKIIRINIPIVFNHLNFCSALVIAINFSVFLL